MPWRVCVTARAARGEATIHVCVLLVGWLGSTGSSMGLSVEKLAASPNGPRSLASCDSYRSDTTSWYPRSDWAALSLSAYWPKKEQANQFSDMAHSTGLAVSTPSCTADDRSCPEIVSRRLTVNVDDASSTEATTSVLGLRYLYFTPLSPSTRPMDATGSWSGREATLTILWRAGGEKIQVGCPTERGPFCLFLW